MISYADDAAGHLGTIYQATNWLYTGTVKTEPLYVYNGKIVHNRKVRDRHGTTRTLSRRTLNDHHSKVVSTKRFRTVDHLGRDADVILKHRYVYLLDPSLRKNLTKAVLPYPKRRGKIDKGITR